MEWIALHDLCWTLLLSHQMICKQYIILNHVFLNLLHTSHTPCTSCTLTPLTPLTPVTPFILICILKDDWMHPVTPFQNQNFHQSDPCKIGLLIIKVLKAPLYLVPKSPAPLNSMNKLTLTNQQL